MYISFVLKGLSHGAQYFIRFWSTFTDPKGSKTVSTCQCSCRMGQTTLAFHKESDVSVVFRGHQWHLVTDVSRSSVVRWFIRKVFYSIFIQNKQKTAFYNKMCQKNHFFFLFKPCQDRKEKWVSFFWTDKSKSKSCIEKVTKPPVLTSHYKTVPPCFCITETGPTAVKNY